MALIVDPAAGLSPWPTEGDALTNAIARLKVAIAGRANSSDGEAAALGAAAAARVEEYAPGAPQAIQDEAVIRYAGWLAQSDYGGIVRESVGGVREVEYTVNHAVAWRNCGAAGLLAPWRVHRAGVIA